MQAVIDKIHAQKISATMQYKPFWREIISSMCGEVTFYGCFYGIEFDISKCNLHLQCKSLRDLYLHCDITDCPYDTAISKINWCRSVIDGTDEFISIMSSRCTIRYNHCVLLDFGDFTATYEYPDIVRFPNQTFITGDLLGIFDAANVYGDIVRFSARHEQFSKFCIYYGGKQPHQLTEGEFDNMRYVYRRLNSIIDFSRFVWPVRMSTGTPDTISERTIAEYFLFFARQCIRVCEN